jgi:hypothetical protein
VDFLVFLFRSGGTSKATFVWNAIGGNYDTTKNSALRLKKAELITISEHSGKSAYIQYELTELGRSVAAHLADADDCMNGVEKVRVDPPGGGVRDTAP